MRRHAAPVLAATLIALATPLHAQLEPQPKPVRAYAGGGLILAQPVGEFEDFIDGGIGFGGHFLLKLDRAGAFGIRTDAGFVIYGHESRRVCLSTTVGCRVQVDLNTTNDIAFASIGPQLTFPSGPVQPYVNGSIGIAYFSTRSSIEGLGDAEDHFDTTNFDDVTFAWQAGTGLRVPLRVARVPVALDLGARYNTNGRVEYLREGDISDHPDGSITLHPQHSQANMVTWLIGATIGIRW